MQVVNICSGEVNPCISLLLCVQIARHLNEEYLIMSMISSPWFLLVMKYIILVFPMQVPKIALNFNLDESTMDERTPERYYH